jgi:plasmid replication initiation protein
VLPTVNVKERHFVVMGNPLVEAHYKLGEIEQKLLRVLISMIKPHAQGFEKQYYRVSVKEFEKFIGRKDTRSLYKEIHRISSKLLLTPISFWLSDKSKVKTTWIASIRHPERKGWFDFEFSSLLEAQLLTLKEQFTRYYLANISNLKGDYTIRIYELIKQYINSENRSRIIETDELKNIFGLQSKYQFSSNLLRRIIFPSHREICIKTDITFKYRPVKEGRKIAAIEFYDIRQKKQTSFEEDKQVLS